MDSSVSETHGAQEGSAYNGHFACTCYHPLFVFNPCGDLERCALRPGNVHSADGWRAALEPVVGRYRHRMKRRYFRGDAGYANPGICEFLEAENYKYTIRLLANSVLQQHIGWLLKRPIGRPPHAVRRYYASCSYQAASWSKARRVVAKVAWHPGELYPRAGFIVTNMARPPERVTLFYNQRGTAEQHIKEGKNAIIWTRLSCRRFAANAVRLHLHALAYNLANFLRTLTRAPDAGAVLLREIAAMRGSDPALVQLAMKLAAFLARPRGNEGAMRVWVERMALALAAALLFATRPPASPRCSAAPVSPTNPVSPLDVAGGCR